MKVRLMILGKWNMSRHRLASIASLPSTSELKICHLQIFSCEVLGSLAISASLGLVMFHFPSIIKPIQS